MGYWVGPINRHTQSNMSELQPIQFNFSALKCVPWDEWKDECHSRLKYASKLSIPHLPQLLDCTGRCVIVGAAPSITKHMDKIKELSNQELDILCSLNGAHDWVVKNIRPPNIHVVFEADVEGIEVSLGGPPHKEVAYYLASHCHKNLFEQLRGYKRVLWHPWYEPTEYQQWVNRLFKNEFMVSGGYVTFFRTINIALILGYRKFDLFGVDSSFEESSHIEGYKFSDVEDPVTVWGKDEQTGKLREFTTNGSLAFQAYEFMRFCKENQHALSLRVHGDGLLRYVHMNRYPEQYIEDN